MTHLGAAAAAVTVDGREWRQSVAQWMRAESRSMNGGDVLLLLTHTAFRQFLKIITTVVPVNKAINQ